MDLLFEFIFEFVFELFFEAAEYTASGIKRKKGIRRILAIIAAAVLILLYLAVVILMIFVGITALRDNIAFAIFAFALAAFFIIAAVVKFRQAAIKHKKKTNPEN